MVDLDTLENVFTAWSDLISKARKPKGLENWKRLQHVAHKINGKGAKQITFTAVNPATGTTSTHILGSTEGNLKFLLGYGNPGFHLAPYHWQIIDPNLSDDDAEKLYKEKGHPSNPKFWNSFNLDITEEGDLEEGEPHSSVRMEQVQKEKDKKEVLIDGFKVKPADGRIESLATGQEYLWDLVKDTYFSYEHPEVAEMFEEEDTSKSLKPVVWAPSHGEALEELRKGYSSTDWHDNVYPLVKSRFPKPGSLVKIQKNLYGLITHKAVEFYDKEGFSCPIDIYGSEFTEIDLRKGGNIFPSVVLNFATNYMNIDRDRLLQYEHRTDTEVELDYAISGAPTPGVTYDRSGDRRVVAVNGVLRVEGGSL